MEDNRNLFRYGSIILAILVAVCVFSLVKAVMDFVGSGQLTVTTPNEDSIITVSRENSTAKIVGNGDASVHLAPGTYLVGVAREGRISTKSVVVTKGETADVNLSATSTPLLPSSANINFQGTDALKEHGFTDDQITSIRQAIFDFKHDTVRAIIDTNSITSPPRDPNTATIGFSKTFVLTIDGAQYQATASWSDPNSATLALRDQTGATVYDSGNGHD